MVLIVASINLMITSGFSYVTSGFSYGEIAHWGMTERGGIRGVGGGLKGNYYGV